MGIKFYILWFIAGIIIIILAGRILGFKDKFVVDMAGAILVILAIIVEEIVRRKLRDNDQ